MRVFVTGATGFIGSVIVQKLLGTGHHVIGLARSDTSAKALSDIGAEVYRGTLEDPESLKGGAAMSDAIIHTAFDHDFSNFMANCEKDKHAIAAMGSVLKGSDRPFIITSGTGMGNPGPGQLASEDHFDAHHPNPRAISELTGNALLTEGVNVQVVRLPQVHNPVRQGLITPMVEIARAKGVSAYVGDGLNRFPAVHLDDAADAYTLVLEKGVKGQRYNPVAEEGVTLKEIAEALGRGMNIPVVSITMEQAPAHFGWMAMFAGFDMPASSTLTRQRLGWSPTGPGLISDLDKMDYSKV